jgi:hypothetical protein
MDLSPLKGFDMPRINQQQRAPIYYLGIDPGKNGGLCCLRRNSDQKPAHRVMPDSMFDIWRWIEVWSAVPGARLYAVIEQVYTSPQMGVVSAGTFMKGYGALLMALTAAGIPYEEIRPQVWQKALNIPPRKPGKKIKVPNPKKSGKMKTVTKGGETDTQWKKRLRNKAQQLFPSLEVWRGPIGKQLAVADAILIAEYCRRKHQGTM